MKRFLILLFALLLLSSITNADDDYEKYLQRQNVPVEFLNLVYEKYQEITVSFDINPCYLRGDFNGDSKNDLAVLIEDKKTGKKGIAVLHNESDSLIILGAGVSSVGNGGDDFKWMDIWHVYESKEVHQGVDESAPPKLIGEALYVEKSESASGIIYWDGKNYQWYQQGD